MSFSAWLSWVTSGSAGTKSLNRDRRDRVNHHLAADQLLPSHTVVDSLKPGMSGYQRTGRPVAGCLRSWRSDCLRTRAPLASVTCPSRP